MEETLNAQAPAAAAAAAADDSAIAPQAPASPSPPPRLPLTVHTAPITTMPAPVPATMTTSTPDSPTMPPKPRVDVGSPCEFHDTDDDDELGTPLGVAGAGGFDFDDDEFAAHRFVGPSVSGDDHSTRALHAIRRVYIHAKPPKFASEIASQEPDSQLPLDRRRTSSGNPEEAVVPVRSQSVDHAPLNTYRVDFREDGALGFDAALGNAKNGELAILVTHVDRESPAFRAGIVVGDALVSINGQPVEPHLTEAQIAELLDPSQPGPRTIVLFRDCAEVTTEPTQSKSLGFLERRTSRPLSGKISSALSYGGSILGSALKRKKTIVHKGIGCDGCGVESIHGALWSCSVCPNYNLCTECYELGTHGMENSEAMQMLLEATVQYKLQKKCKHFTTEFLLSLRRDVCKGRPDKFEYMGSWIAEIVNGTAASKITVRGIEIPHLPASARQRFVSKLMPLVSNRTDIEVNIEWIPDDSTDRASVDVEYLQADAAEDVERLRIWISDKKSRTASPFT